MLLLVLRARLRASTQLSNLDVLQTQVAGQALVPVCGVAAGGAGQRLRRPWAGPDKATGRQGGAGQGATAATRKLERGRHRHLFYLF